MASQPFEQMEILGGSIDGAHPHDQVVGDLARVHAQRLGQLHRQIAGEIAMRGLLGTIELDRGHRRGVDGERRGARRDEFGGSLAKGGAELLDLVGQHGAGFSQNRRLRTGPS